MEKRILSILLSIIMVVTLLPATVFAATEISYIGVDGNEAKISDYAEINSGNKPTNWSGTYFVNETIEITEAVSLTGDTSLILADGVELTITNSAITGGKTLTIYGQSGQTGKLVVKGSDGDAGSVGSTAITGNVTVYGGVLEVTGGKGGDGVVTDEDTGDNASVGGIGIEGTVTVLGSGNITVLGGTGGNGVNVTCGTSGGGGNVAIKGDLIISGNGSITVNGGNGGNGAGGGNSAGGNGGKAISGDISISDNGKATVNGGTGGNANNQAKGGDGGIGIDGKLTVSGNGEAVVNGGHSGSNEGIDIGVGGEGVNGDVIISNSGTATITGGNGQSNSGGNNGGDGGNGVHDNVIVSDSGKATILGGNGGDSGNGTGLGGNGGKGILGSLTVTGGNIIEVTGGTGGKNSSDTDSKGVGGSGIGGAVTVNGGELFVTGGNGKNSSIVGGKGGNGIDSCLSVFGGIVTITGGNGGSSYYTPGIGSGGCGTTSCVAISGDGIVTLTGGKGGSYLNDPENVHGTDGVAFNNSNDDDISAKVQTSIDGSIYSDWDKSTALNTFYALKLTNAHDHNFTYSASEDTITAACSNREGCPLSDSDYKITLTLSAAGGTYDGITSFPAITDDAATGFTSATKTTPVIEYYKGTDKLDAAPVSAGAYTAKLTLKDADAQIISNAGIVVEATTSYAVSKGAQPITADAIQSFVYLDTDKKVSAAAIGELSYEIKSGAANDVVEVNPLTGELTILKAGTTTVTAIASETDNYNSASKDITVSVAKKQIVKPEADPATFTYIGEVQIYSPAGFNADIMTISGNRKTDASVDVYPAGYLVNVALKDTANYEWSTEGDCTFNWIINKADQPAPTITGVTGSSVTVASADRSKVLQYCVDDNAADANKNWLYVPELNADGSFELVGLGEGNHTVYMKALGTGNYNESPVTSKAFSLNYYCVEYNANGGTGAPAAVTKNKPNTVTVADFTGLKRNGYTAVSWNTKPDGSGDTHSTGSALSDGIILYAQWTANTYTVKFDANGGNGSMESQNMIYDHKDALHLNTTLTRDGYTFAGWSTNKNGPVQFADGQDVTNLAADGEVVLYAIWAEETYQLRVNVISPTSSAVKLEIRRGNSVFTEASVSLTQSGTTYSAIKDINGLAGGVYNIIAKQSLSDKGITESAIQLVIVSTNASIDFNLTNGNVSAELDVKEGTPDVMVNGLNEEAANYDHHSSDVNVKMTVEQQEECELPLDATPEERETQKAIRSIKNVSASDVLSYMDITVEKTDIVDNVAQPAVRIDETSNVMEIAVPFDPSEKYNVRVYRNHGDNVEPFTRLNSRPAVFTDGTYYVDEENCLVYIYAKKFSTYAIGYNTQPDAPADYGYGSGTSDEYPIKLNASLNGNVDLSANKSPKGRTIIISANANSGFGVGRVVVLTADGKPVTLKDLGNGKYSFVMPASAVTVNVMFAFVSSVADCPRDETCPIDPFGDTENDYWWHDGVHYCIENGLMIGVTKVDFKPLADTSRAMLATILWRLSGSPVEDYQYTFKDVSEGAWYTEAVRWAQKNKVFEGYSTEEFGPDDAITREQMMTVFCRYYKFRGNTANCDFDLSVFKDAGTISDYAIDGVKWSVNNCVIQGDGDYLNPKSNCTRAQTANIVQRFCEMFGLLNK